MQYLLKMQAFLKIPVIGFQWINQNFWKKILINLGGKMPKAYKIGNKHEFKVNEFDPMIPAGGRETNLRPRMKPKN